MDIYEYLSSKSIIISDERFKGNVEVSISEQIKLISDAHKRLLAGKEAIYYLEFKVVIEVRS